MAKSYGRNERIASSLLREASRILATEIKDPRIQMATVTEVRVAPDLRNATIFVSFIDDSEDKVSEAMQVLDKARGYIRSTMASRLKMRYMPKITFSFDTLIKESMRIDALIARGLGDSDEPGLRVDEDYDDPDYDNDQVDDSNSNRADDGNKADDVNSDKDTL